MRNAASVDVRFSNRPFRVKRFQTIHHYSVDVAHGLVLLFGIGTRGPSIMGFEDEVEQSSLIGHSGSSAFRLSTTTVSMSPTGSCFSSESAPGPFHHGVRRRGGAISSAALPSDERQVQADMRTHLIDRPARDIIPPVGGAQVSSYPV